MITAKEMKELEKHAEECGISALELMERAGQEVADAIIERFPDIKDKRVLVICGKGNNGGDGLVAARYLYDLCKITIVTIGTAGELSEAASVNYDQLYEIDSTILHPYDAETATFLDMTEYDIIIDALLGTGVKGTLYHPYSTLVRDMNSSKAFIVSVDIPSGTHPDEKKLPQLCARTDLIITFHDTKQIHTAFKQKTIVVDIGIPF